MRVYGAGWVEVGRSRSVVRPVHLDSSAQATILSIEEAKLLRRYLSRAIREAEAAKETTDDP